MKRVGKWRWFFHVMTRHTFTYDIRHYGYTMPGLGGEMSECDHGLYYVYPICRDCQ